MQKGLGPNMFDWCFRWLSNGHATTTTLESSSSNNTSSNNGSSFIATSGAHILPQFHHSEDEEEEVVIPEKNESGSADKSTFSSDSSQLPVKCNSSEETCNQSGDDDEGDHTSKTCASGAANMADEQRQAEGMSFLY